MHAQEYLPPLKDFATLRQSFGLPYCHAQVPIRQRRAPDTREGGEGVRAGLALVTPIGDSRTSFEADTRSVGSVGRLRARRPCSSAGKLLTPQRRHMRGNLVTWTAHCRSWRSFNPGDCSNTPVTDPVSALDIGTGSDPVRGRYERLGVFVSVSLSTRRRAAILSVAYQCGQARGTLNMKLRTL